MLLARRARQAGGADAVRHRDLALRAEEDRPSTSSRAPTTRPRYVTFYSDRLMMRAQELGLGRPRAARRSTRRSATRSRWHDEDAQRRRARRSASTNAHLLLNVKRLHPLAGQRYLIEAMNEVDPPASRHAAGHLRHRARCSTSCRSVARRRGVERHVTFAGLIDNAAIARYCAAADLFVLPSLLEALPTVAVEALASRTPVLSSDNPGGAGAERRVRHRTSRSCRGSSRWRWPPRSAISSQHKRRTLTRTRRG